MTTPGFSIHKAEGYEPSDRTVAALEALAVALIADHGGELGEVDGFASKGGVGRDLTKPEVGIDFTTRLKPRLSGPAPLQFCAGYYADNPEEDIEVCLGIFF